MRLQIADLAAALALAAGCHKGPDNASQGATRADAPAPQAQVNTPTTPANAGQPSPEEKREGANPPVQGQVDAKQGEQHKDFQHSGDGAGPKDSNTPKRGG